MIYIDNKSFDPAYSFAAEIYYMEKLKEPFFMLWRTKPCVIIGRYQNLYKEANLDYIQKENIMIRRRFSGGGAVYADGGSLKYSVFIPGKAASEADFRRDASAFVDAMNLLGVNAEFTQRNDIYIQGRKCAGNARFSNANGVMHHLTVLFNTDLSKLQLVLSDKTEKIRDRAIDSHRQHVCNVTEFLDEQMDTDAFKNHILKNIFGGNYTYREITEEEDRELERLADTMFRCDEYIYGKNPSFEKSDSKRFEGGTVKLGMTVEKSRIKDIGISGDFFASGDVALLENALKGCRLDKEELKRAVQLHPVIQGVTADEIVSLIIS